MWTWEYGLLMQGIGGSEGDEDMNEATGDEDIPYDDEEEDDEADVEDEAAMGIGTMQVLLKVQPLMV